MMEIRLYGRLGTLFGRRHERHLETDTVREAMSALDATIDGFGRFLREAEAKGLVFAVFRGRRNIGEDELDMRGDEVIRVVPVVQGSKKAGLLQVIVGIALIVVGAFMGFNVPVMMAGASMALGGVIQMLSPQPSYATKDDPENTPSYAFGGAVNTVANGYPVGLLYGRRRVGGAVISAGVYSEDTL